jgi:hypothetical protein
MAEIKPRLSVKGPIEPAAAVAATNTNHFKKTTRVRSYTLDDDEGDWHKVMTYGLPGTGKTYVIIGYLLNGEKVYVMNTDLGGNGLGTVKRHLKKIGRTDLLKNLAFVDLADYDEVEVFLTNPTKVVNSDEFDLWAWAPTVLVWEGYSFFQQVHVDEKVLSMAAVAKDGVSKVELRNEGMFAVEADWNAIRRLTIRHANKFLNIHNPVTGQRIHKYVTFQEKDPEKDSEGKVKIGGKVLPMLWTGAATLMSAGFDLVIHTVGKNKADGAEYFYECVQTDTKYGKNREYPLKGIAPADWTSIWAKIKSGEVG